ncbi:MAG: uracil-DNA glycosylase [Zetaproteobacteria bacterium]|nr:uracil-DNA glycosylase [Zetaproteobacteria bacterium]
MLLTVFLESNSHTTSTLNAATTGEFDAFYLSQIGIHTPQFITPNRAPASISTLEPNAFPDPLSQPEKLATTEVNTNTNLCNDQAIHPASPISAIKSENNWDEINREIRLCERCELSHHRKQSIVGRGSSKANILFISEAPTQEDDFYNQPISGHAESIFKSLIKAMQWRDDDIFLLNIVRCHTPNHRSPKQQELHECTHWLRQQISVIRPTTIAVLGRTAAQSLLDTDLPLAQLRGRWHQYQEIPVWVTYHPALMLRTPKQKSLLWQDLCQMKQNIQRISNENSPISTDRQPEVSRS